MSLLNLLCLQLISEVTYAELCLARPTTLSTTTAGVTSQQQDNIKLTTGLSALAGFSTISKSFVKESTVYACIDHNAKINQTPLTNSPSPQIANNNSNNSLIEKNGHNNHHHHHHPREVVTVRTPLISSQESCV